jgi:hypothetical protein
MEPEMKVGDPKMGDSSLSESKGPELPKPKIDPDDARFVCNICLDPVHDSVVTVCGHLYW